MKSNGRLSSLSIFFPFFNDAGTVHRQIEDAYRYGKELADDLEVIAIHGGRSSDDTLASIEGLRGRFPDLRIVDCTTNRAGYAVIAHGFAAATKDWVFYTDGDAQYHLDDLARLVERQIQTGADVVNGYKMKRRDPVPRRVLGEAYRRLGRMVLDLPIRDPDCDFRLIRRRYLEQIDFESQDSAILAEMVKKLQFLGARFTEVGVNHYPRTYGRSNYSVLGLVREKLISETKVWLQLRRYRADSPGPSGSSARTEMFKEEYSSMFAAEDDLWWYAGLRDLMRSFIESFDLKDPVIFDAGCGTGKNLEFLQELGLRAQGTDISPDALRYCEQRGLKNVTLGSATELPLGNGSVDIVLSFDVLHLLPGVQRRRALDEIFRVLKPGGFVLVNCAALEWLRSQHDDVCNVRRRFTLEELVKLFADRDCDIQCATYRVFFLFPLVATVKLCKRVLRAVTRESTTDQAVPVAPANWLFTRIQLAENRLIRSKVTLPVGSSVFLVARKNGG
jgi:SAM-dependent methyltransferase